MRTQEQEKEIKKILEDKVCTSCGYCKDARGNKIYPCVMRKSAVDRRG